jgi:hypothetical protein
MSVECETEATDRQALLLMLSYVEAECRRLGAVDAARHAALAAGLLPEMVPANAAPEPIMKKGTRGLRLH